MTTFALLVPAVISCGAALHRFGPDLMRWHERRSTLAAIGRILREGVEANDGLAAWVVAESARHRNRSDSRGVDWLTAEDAAGRKQALLPASLQRVLDLAPRSRLLIGTAFPDSHYGNVRILIRGLRANFTIYFSDYSFHQHPPTADQYRAPRYDPAKRDQEVFPGIRVRVEE